MDLWGTPRHDYFEPGLFNGCLGFSHENINGKYFIASSGALRAHNTFNNEMDFNSFYQRKAIQKDFEHGICVPKDCSESEMMNIGNKMLSTLEVMFLCKTNVFRNAETGLVGDY